MRWRFNGDTCCACGSTPSLNCCEGSLLTHAPENYLESFETGRQDSGGTWHDQELIESPIQFFSSDVDWVTGAENYDIFNPCAGSHCQYDFAQIPTLIQTGTGLWDTSTRWGVWDSLHSPPRNNDVIGQSVGLIIDNNFRLLIPSESDLSCAPSLLVQLNVGIANHPDYYKRQLPPNISSYLSGLTWGYGTAYPFKGELTFRFPLYQNYCWPATGPDAVSGYCNLAEATLTNGSYDDGSTTSTQSGSQTWTFTNNDNYLEIPFGSDTLQFRPSTTANEEGILYMHLNGGFFFNEKFEITGSCDGSVTWTSLNNPTHSVSFDISGGGDCASCEDIGGVPTGCCVMTDGTVDASSTSSSCTAAGGTYSGDGSSCPDVGCCTLPDTSVEGNVTEAYCTAQSGTWVSGDCPAIPTGCCEISGQADESGVTEAYCTAQGGTWTEGVSCTTGWCIDNATGLVTANVEEDECTGTWSATEPAVGCCEISGQANESNVVESYCTAQGGTWNEGENCTTGWCINDTTGAITANVEEDECTGTWSATEPTSGCCNISGTEHPDVAQSWCTGQSGTFTAGDCPEPTFDPCGESWAASINYLFLDMDDPNFDLSNPFYFSNSAWTQSTNALRRDVCSAFGAQLDNSTSSVYGDNTGDPTTLSIASNLSVNYISGSGTWTVDLYLTWTYLSTSYNITATKSGISIPSAGCPTVTILDTFDTFSGNYVQYGGGNTFDVNDLVGSFSVTLTCE